MTDHDEPRFDETPDPTSSAAGKRRRSWWPAMIGAVLASAAVIGVVIIRADDTAVAPVQTEPEVGPEPTASSTPAPTTTAVASTTAVPSTTSPGPTGTSLVIETGCITVTTTAGSATGCPSGDAELDHLEHRVFVADLDGPVVITAGSADPLVDLTATVDTAGFASSCQWDDLAPRIADGGLVELVVCNDTGVMALTMPTGPVDDSSPSYFTLPTQYLPEGADLGAGTSIDGLPRALAFTAAVQDTTACSILLLPDRSGWKEACGFIHGLDLTTALVQLGPVEGDVHEISVDDAGVITQARSLEAMAPSSGCSFDAARDLMRAMPEASVVMGIGCVDDKAALITGSVLAQQGRPDGSIWTALRDEAGVWAITDSGTGIDSNLTFPVAPVAAWETWPESTVPGFRSYWWEPIVTIPTQPTVEALAEELLTTIGTLATDPEFPLNERLVEIQPGGLPLIIAQVDLGGDDSVVGAVIYVWLGQVFDEEGPIGWQATEVLVGDVCGRGGSVGQTICI